MGSSVGSGGFSVGSAGLSVGAAAGGSVGSGASVSVLQAPKTKGNTKAISSTHAITLLDMLLPPLEFFMSICLDNTAFENILMRKNTLITSYQA
jgi:hypothetical protein